MCGSSFRLRTLKAKIDDESAFISSLAEVAVPAGGWAAYGAHKTIASLIGPDVQHPDYDQIRGTALQCSCNLKGSTAIPSTTTLSFWRMSEGAEYPGSVS